MGRRGRDVPWLEQRENGFYYVHWYDKDAGRTRRQSLDTRDADEAAKAYGQFLIAGPGGRPGAAPGLTVAQALADYKRERLAATDDRGRPLVVATERQLVSIDRLTTYFGSTPITQIGPLESKAYLAARRAGQVAGGKRQRGDGRGSDSTVRRELVVLVAAFNHAVKWGRINAVCRVELPAENIREKVLWLTKRQIGHAIDTAEGDLRDFIQIAYYTAARRRSIEELLVSQVDLRRGTIDLMQPDARATKKRKPVVPIYPDIRPVIERLMDQTRTRWLWGSPRSFYRPFVEHMSDIGLDAHPHMLRHSRATHMLMDGESVWKVAKLLGDTIKTVESTYAHVSPDFLATDSRIGE